MDRPGFPRGLPLGWCCGGCCGVATDAVLRGDVQHPILTRPSATLSPQGRADFCPARRRGPTRGDGASSSAGSAGTTSRQNDAR